MLLFVEMRYDRLKPDVALSTIQDGPHGLHLRCFTLFHVSESHHFSQLFGRGSFSALCCHGKDKCNVC
jgi:hypothetical protein